MRLHHNAFSHSPDMPKIWQKAARYFRHLMYVFTLFLPASLISCSSMPEIRFEVGEPTSDPRVFTSLVVAGEPQAALTAIDVLTNSGRAADAAAALGLALSVTLPSAASLSGDTSCVVYDSLSKSAESFKSNNRKIQSDTYTSARGLFAMHAAHGTLPWARIVSPAETLARFGHPVSNALARDLEYYGQILAADRSALDLFMTDRRQVMEAGDQLVQTELADTLAEIRENVIKTLDYSRQDMADGAQPVTRDSAMTSVRIEKYLKFSTESAGPRDGSSHFMVSDPQGQFVACVVSMGRIFGDGVAIEDTGVLKAFPYDASNAIQRVSIEIYADEITGEVLYASASSNSNAEESDASTAVFRDQPTPGVSVVNCERTSYRADLSCRILADPSQYGYAQVIRLGN